VADHHPETGRASLEGFRGEIRAVDVAEKIEIPGRFDTVFHQAAITDPRHADDEETLQKNLTGFENVVSFCLGMGARLIYASTAGLYGNGPLPMREDQELEILTAYGESKRQIDSRAETLFERLPIVGLRYFNVFGPREAHKGRPASMILHLAGQIRQSGRARLFKHGEQRRDFIYVKDVVQANLNALSAPSGIYNVGTGVGTTFNDLVAALTDVLGTRATIEYFDMPFDPATYQHHTVADTRLARERLGFKASWALRPAIADYLQWMTLSRTSR
jgi:ADP-L-glycero-D-manno-heptose 6-epimerase